MGKLLVIVGDTWRQSRQQVVFRILCVLLALVALIAVAYPKVLRGEDGTKEFGFQFVEGPVEWPAEAWMAQSMESLIVKSDERANPLDPEQRDQRKADEEKAKAAVEAQAQNITRFERSVEFWTWIVAQAIFSISMLLFIGACASYFPGMLASGAVDVVLAKPITRLQVFLGKYLGGLVLYAAVVTAAYLVVLVGLGLRTGTWPVGLLQVIPLQVFAAGVLYAILALFGVLTRSATFAVIVGYVFYLLIDTAVAAAGGIQRMGVSADIPLLDRFLSLAHYMPNFEFLKQVATNSCLNLQSFDPRPVVVATVWTALTLGLGYWKFRRADF